MTFNLFLSLLWAGLGLTAAALFLIGGHYIFTKNLEDVIDDEPTEPSKYARYEARITRVIE